MRERAIPAISRNNPETRSVTATRAIRTPYSVLRGLYGGTPLPHPLRREVLPCLKSDRLAVPAQSTHAVHFLHASPRSRNGRVRRATAGRGTSRSCAVPAGYRTYG